MDYKSLTFKNKQIMKNYLHIQYVIDNKWHRINIRLTEIRIVNKILKDGGKDMRITLMLASKESYKTIFGSK